jgi:hypothetical protein
MRPCGRRAPTRVEGEVDECVVRAQCFPILIGKTVSFPYGGFFWPVRVSIVR